MKRLHEIIRPFLAIILGALILLMNLNNLQGQDKVLAYGILGIVAAALYVAIGIIGLTLNNRLPSSAKRAFEIVSVVTFPILMFVYFLLSTIAAAEAEILGPNGWFLSILKMAASICFALVYLVAGLVKERHLNKLALLLASVFILALLLEVLFDILGNAIGLGGIIVVEVVVYFIYGNILFNSLPNAKGEPAPVEEPESEEPAAEEEAEEAPAEEAPAEE